MSIPNTLKLEETRLLASLTAEEREHFETGFGFCFDVTLEELKAEGETFYFLKTVGGLAMALAADMTLAEVWAAAELFEAELEKRGADGMIVTYNFTKAFDGPEVPGETLKATDSGRAKRLPNQPFYRGLKRYSK